MKLQTLLTIATSTIIMASFPLSANPLKMKSYSYTPKCEGGKIKVVNQIGEDYCREADSSFAPHCIISYANQPPSKQKGWIIKITKANDICTLKNSKKTPDLYVNPRPVCKGSYKLKINKNGSEDRCVKSAKKYRLRCKKDEAHLTRGLDKCVNNGTDFLK